MRLASGHRPRAGRGAGRFLLIIIAGIVIGLVVGLSWPRLQKLLGKPATPTATTKAEEGPRHLTVTEKELTERLRTAAGAQAQDVKVTLQPGVMIVTGSVSRQGFSAPVKVELEPFVEQGKLNVKVRSAKLGPVPLPAALTEKLAAQAGQALAQQQGKLKGLAVDTVEVKQGEMLLTGHFDRKG